MVKRYIQSYVSSKYVFALPGLAFGVFVFAFLYTTSGNPVMRYIGIAIGLVLFAVMAVYYREKFMVSRQLKKVPDLNAFNDAVMIGMAFFLEERMLGYKTGQVFDLKYDDIRSVSFEENNRGKLFLNLETGQGTLPVEMALKDQAARVAQFLHTKNPSLTVSGITPSGAGTLHSIDPYRNERK